MKSRLVMIVFMIIGMYVFCETVYMKDGSILTGSIISQNEKEIVLKGNLGEIRIDKKQIDKIEYDSELNKKGSNEIKKRIANGGFMIRPLASILAGLLGSNDIIFEGMTALNKKIVLNAIGEIATTEGLIATGLNVGIQYNLTGEYLDGLYLGIFPGYIYATDFYDEATAFSAMIELGYQGISKSGFAWGAYVGYTFSVLSNFKFGVKIGWAFPDPLIKISEE
jgi:hypothetical protein